MRKRYIDVCESMRKKYSMNYPDGNVFDHDLSECQGITRLGSLRNPKYLTRDKACRGCKYRFRCWTL